jgi:hypothetical protein
MRFSRADATALVAELDVDYHTWPVCLACLTVVSFPLDSGDERRARRAAITMAPDLWADGLDVPTMLELQRARDRGIERAAEAIRDVEQFGSRSEVVRAVVYRLAEAQVEEMRTRAALRRLDEPP